mmetsp:Transcript_1834/g.1276  ORF Transcript_1834/g.1276 Transcript_1834/m.1276 type:complete len:738 (-) Transcript_1834:104-2317(-)|eukprot:CAMPEP_0201281082 /NCGR_PEP_ID=MMETSP1317-20130820/1303_1 /ASSEMBLY_ACC=CAM_ASM_000770 /TAXON_ID=187299 /ORGANISM="Undescribed Undescribed, Strain Undescribed" /LENGTH=737 /DNA_ID=CAMNT_0047590005 /DNA_START=180 /DNA_END=2393 /DNA_ORIENTATION=-
MSGKFPQSENLEEFWRHLESGDNLITEIPEDRWDWKEYYGDPEKEANKTNSKWGGFMKDVDKFDASFFKTSPREAELMDPQQRIFLETVWSCIEDAGYKASDLSETNTGLFVGVATTDYAELLREKGAEIESYTATGMSLSIVANRISHFLNFQGPSESIDTACSSSTVAINRAITACRQGECDMAIAGGVNVLLTPSGFIAFSKLGMLCDDRNVKTFDKDANGYARGEGVGAVLLKPLKKAEADRNHIYAVIKGTAVNHGGRGYSLTAPNPIAQSRVIIDAYKNAGINPETVNYIEANGTGTNLGDPVEINGFKESFLKLSNNNKHRQIGYCAVGSIKPNIGHLEATSGIASLFKVILSLKHKKIPATINFDQLNPYIDIKESPFYIVDKMQIWEPLKDESGSSLPLRASINSFGFGGSNAHLVIEEYKKVTEEAQRHKGTKSDESQIFVFSAKNEERLKVYANNMVNFLEKAEDKVDLIDVAYTLQAGRNEMQERLAIVVSGMTKLIEKLAKYCQDKKNIEDLYTGNVKIKDTASELLLEGREGAEFVKIIIQDRKLTKLARLWVLGVEMDWQLLYPEGMPDRVSLPTYPFKKERYWIPESNESFVALGRRKTQEVIEHRDSSDSGASLQKKVENELIGLCSDFLKVKAEELDIDVDLIEYGLDSIMMISVLHRLEEIYGKVIDEPNPTVFVEYPTIRRFAEYLIDSPLLAGNVELEPTTAESKGPEVDFDEGEI